MQQTYKRRVYGHIFCVEIMRLVQVRYDLSHLQLITLLKFKRSLSDFSFHIIPQLKFQPLYVYLLANGEWVKLYFLIIASKSIESVARIDTEHVFQIINLRLLH